MDRLVVKICRLITNSKDNGLILIFHLFNLMESALHLLKEIQIEFLFLETYKTQCFQKQCLSKQLQHLRFTEQKIRFKHNR